MDIEPGTRVRSPEGIPAFTDGSYVKWDGYYHIINWGNGYDGIDRPGYHHFADEFEVIS